METTTTKVLAVWETIAQQIGNGTFYMLGAKGTLMYSASDPNWLSFKIKGCKKINYIKISYTYDEYTMEFGKLTNMRINRKTFAVTPDKYEIVETVSGVTCDMLHKMIESRTGLYTRL